MASAVFNVNLDIQGYRTLILISLTFSCASCMMKFTICLICLLESDDIVDNGRYSRIAVRFLTKLLLLRSGQLVHGNVGMDVSKSWELLACASNTQIGGSKKSYKMSLN